VKMSARYGGGTMSALSVDRRGVPPETDPGESVHTAPANDAHWVINLSYRDQHRLADG
jgi:hypothetical protein